MLRTGELQEDEEFQEADILWPDDAAEVPESPRVYHGHAGTDDDDGDYSGEPRLPMKPQLWQKASSPIDIPGRKKSGAPGEAKGTDPPAGRFSGFGVSLPGFSGGAGSVVVGSNVFVPPHVIVDRRAKREKAMMMMMLVVPSGKARERKIRD